MKGWLHGLLVVLVSWAFFPLAWAQPVTPAATEKHEPHLQTHRAQEQQNLAPEPDIPRAHAEEPLPPPNQEDASPAESPPVTETRLWQFLRQQRYATLRQEIRRLRRNNPTWSPPRKLLALLAAGEVRQTVDNSIARQDWLQIVALSQRYPGQFTCAQIHHLWALAEARSMQTQPEAARAVYEHILAHCERADYRLATLQKAQAQLPPEMTAALLQREAAFVYNAQQVQFADLRYAFEASRLSAAFDAKDFATALTYEEDISADVYGKHDANIAMLLGWSHFHVQHWSQAAEWFSHVVSWDDQREDAAYGLALTQFKQGRFPEAEALARRRADTSEKMRSLLGEVLLARARDSRERKEFRDSLALAHESEQYRVGGREIQSLKAWNLYDLGETAQAAEEFAALYRSHPDHDSAQGALYSYTREKDWPKLARLAHETPGPLTLLWATALGQREYEHKLFLLAHRTAPDSLPPLQNINSPTITSGIAYRQKSGARGLGRLDEEIFPFAEGAIVYEGIHTLSLRFSRVTLDAGHLPANARIGSVPRSPTAYSLRPTTRLNGGVEPSLTYTLAGWLSPYAELGMTPSEGEVSMRPTWRLGFAQERDAGHWQVETFSRPVKESLLSYTGIVDPYSGKKWGRVRETGASLSGYEEVKQGWGVSGQASLAVLRGLRVPSNYHVGLNAGLTRTFTPDGFEYLALGPRVAFDHYQKNLSQFTVGHGGYFSPSHLLQFTAAMNFLTQEARQFIATGDLSVGVQTHHQEGSPFFPHQLLDSRRYSARNESGPVVSAEFTGVWRFSDHWQIGGGGLVRKTANYDDWSAMFFVRFLLEPRAGVFSTDNPQHLLHMLY